MQEVEGDRRTVGHKPQKYYGKWPFIRILGVQEMASVVFSLANLAMHIVGMLQLLSASKKRALGQPQRGHSKRFTYPFTGWWLAYGGFHVAAWGASAVFHTRDLPITERIDYVCAILVVAMGLMVSLVRTLNRPGLWAALPLVLLVGAGAVWHVGYMLTVSWHYAWNIKVCVAAGVLTALVWVVWILHHPAHPGRWWLLAFLGLAHAALLLELLDFPPILGSLLHEKGLPTVTHMGTTGLGLVDAHALWHLATVPLTAVFYRFITTDVMSWDSKPHTNLD